MNYKSRDNKFSIVTTSWDDGHPLDIRLAELLKSYGIAGTFYVPRRFEELPVMSREQIRSVRAMGMEIGSHSFSHVVLTKLCQNELLNELRKSKSDLEDIIGEPITSLCYPRGKYNRLVRSSAIDAGYRLARTIITFRTEIRFDRFCMPTSLQLFAHPKRVHILHALGDKNFKGLKNWFLYWKSETDILRLSYTMIEYIKKYGGIYHLWGHSWEIDKFGLWVLLEEVLKLISNQSDFNYLTNSQILDIIT